MVSFAPWLSDFVSAIATLFLIRFACCLDFRNSASCADFSQQITSGCVYLRKSLSSSSRRGRRSFCGARKYTFKKTPYRREETAGFAAVEAGESPGCVVAREGVLAGGGGGGGGLLGAPEEEAGACVATGEVAEAGDAGGSCVAVAGPTGAAFCAVRSVRSCIRFSSLSRILLSNSRWSRR